MEKATEAGGVLCCDSEDRPHQAPGARGSRLLDSRRRETQVTRRHGLRGGHRATGHREPHYVTLRSPSPIFSSFSYFCIFLLITQAERTHSRAQCFTTARSWPDSALQTRSIANRETLLRPPSQPDSPTAQLELTRFYTCTLRTFVRERQEESVLV